MDTAIVILAAGESRRFGDSIKQLAPINGQAMINRQLEFYLGFQLPVILVLGAFLNDIISKISPHLQSKITIIENIDWQLGVGNSISCSTLELKKKNYKHALLTLLDQVYLTHEDILKLLKHSECHPENIVTSSYSQQQGVPAIFPKTYFDDLENLDTDLGAKSIIMCATRVKSVSIPSAARDIDTHEQWSTLKAELC